MKYAIRFWGALILSCCAFPAGSFARDANADVKVIEGFIAAVKENKELSAETVQKAVDAAETLKAEEDARPLAITEGLREIYPDFRAALTALGEENLAGANAALGSLATSADPYLAAEASYFLARVKLLEERYEQALPLLAALETKYAEKTARSGEALFLKGVAQGQTLQRADAAKTLRRFIEEYPHAPERMKIGAWRQIEQLKLIEDGKLSDAQFRMDFSRRRLALEDAGEETQGEQKKIVGILETLIKEAEDREASGKGSGKGKGQGKKQGKAGEGEGQGEGKQGEGKQGGNTGGGSKGIDSDAVERLHRGGPQSPWSQLRDKDRDPVFNAIKEKFPGRYQQLIEQYYKSFEEDQDG